MFCVTVTPTSRTLAKVDILNASRMGGVVEVCLDFLAKEPDFSDMLEGLDVPVIFSCRRREDGGHWKGTEEERIMLLKRAIVAGPKAIELDEDAAQAVPRFGKTERVVAFTNLEGPEYDLEDLLERARGCNADVVKFCWPMTSLEDAWPLLKMVATKRSMPIVGMGRGRAEITFSLLSQKFEAPWIYAALERGMEAHESQPTVTEMREVFSADEINAKTSFVAVTGLGRSTEITVEALNTAFREVGKSIRCLPIESRDGAALGKRLAGLKIKALIAAGQSRGIAKALVEDDGPADVYLHSGDQWKGYSTLARSAVSALEKGLNRPWSRTNVVVLGCNADAATIAADLAGRGGVVSVSAFEDKKAAAIASEVGCRHLPFPALYQSLADVAVIADPGVTCGLNRKDVNPGYLKPEMTLVDLTDPPMPHPLTLEARERQCTVIEPLETYRQHLRALFKTLSGGESLPEGAWQRVEARLSEA